MEIADALKQIRDIQTIRQQHAAALVAVGIFSDNEEWTEVAGGLAAPKAKRTAAALEAWLGNEYVPNPDGSKQTIAKSDLLCQLYSHYLDAGFLVGVAVGMQLGPHAFDGIGEKTKGGKR
jgi:hypothetical protein